MKKICFLCFCIFFFYSCQPPSNQEEKFQHINETMEDLLIDKYENCKNRLQYLKDAIRKEGNTKIGRKQKERAIFLLGKTEEALDKIEVLKSLLTESNKTEGEGTVRKIMIEEQKGILLQKDLQAYVDWLNKECKGLSGFSELDPLMVDNQEKNNSNGVDQNKSFIETLFGQTGIYETKAYLSYLQIEIIRSVTSVIDLRGLHREGDGIETLFPIKNCYERRALVEKYQDTIILGDTFMADAFIGHVHVTEKQIISNQHSILLDYNPLEPNYREHIKSEFLLSSKGGNKWKGAFTNK